MIKDSSYYKVPNTNKYEIYVELEEDVFLRLMQLSLELATDVEELAKRAVISSLIE